jgi:hypothetical protein
VDLLKLPAGPGGAAPLLVLGVAAVLAGCSPDIANGTYFCGPERFCPPGQECDDNRHICDSPRLVSRFECPAGTELFEPNDTLESAEDAGDLTCGNQLFEERHGCVASAGDVDLFTFAFHGPCLGDDPHLAVRLRFPIALVPLTIELLDESGRVIGEGQLCTPSGDVTGTDRLCIDMPLESGQYYLRVRSAPDGPDCAGDCHHNRYTLDVLYSLA